MVEARARRFPRYLEAALHALAREAAGHFAAVRASLGARTVVVRVADACAASVCLAGEPPWVRGADGPFEAAGDVTVALSARDLEAFLRGHLTIEEGVEADRLAVRGPIDDVLALLDALHAWLHGALRAPSLPRLHAEFLAPP